MSRTVYNHPLYVTNLNTVNEKDKPIIEKKLIYVPHGVDTNLFKPQKKTKRFTFFACKGWNSGKEDRGGIQYVIQAFVEEFSKDEPVDLKLKINPAYLNPSWDLKAELDKLGLKNKEDRPLIHINQENIDYKQMPKLYDGDVFVCATRGEAYNLPGLEAHSCGMPTIQTDFGGQTDYMQPDLDIYIPYTLSEVTTDVLNEGIQWATPDIKELRKLMRWAYNNRSEVARRGKILRENAMQHSWANSAKRLIEGLQKYED